MKESQDLKKLFTKIYTLIEEAERESKNESVVSKLVQVRVFLKEIPRICNNAVSAQRHIKALEAKLKRAESHYEILKRSNENKRINLQKLSLEHDFLRKRVKQFYGLDAFKKIMLTVESPSGFDQENFDKKNELKKEKENEQTNTTESLHR